MKNKILLGAGVVLALAIIVIIISLTGSGRFFQGALYNLRPIYTSCRIEGQNYNSTNLDDCEYFFKKFAAKTFPDGEYTIFTKYTDKKLPENIIPIRIKNQELECTYRESGYQPIVNLFDPNNQLSSETIKTAAEIPVNVNGLIAQINFSKNTHIYPYDSNICEAAFQAKVFDSKKIELGTAKLDYNGFINSRPLVNELFISNYPYYSDKNNPTIKSFAPGNIYTNINILPDLSFKLTIACSDNFPKVTIPSQTVSNDTTLVFQGLTREYLATCASKLYLSFQNTNRYDDIQNSNSNLTFTALDDNSASYDLKLIDLARINDPNTRFPFIYNIQLNLRDRSDANFIRTLGSGVLTISAYNRPKVEIQPTTSSSTSISISQPKSEDETLLNQNNADNQPIMAPVSEEPAQESTSIPVPTSFVIPAPALNLPVENTKTYIPIVSIDSKPTYDTSKLPITAESPLPNKIPVKVRYQPEAITILPKTSTIYTTTSLQ